MTYNLGLKEEVELDTSSASESPNASSTSFTLTSDFEQCSTTDSDYQDLLSVESDEDSTEESFEPEQEMDTSNRLYDGSPGSYQQWSLAMLSIFLKHNLTYSCVDDLLKLFRNVLPFANSIPRSNYSLLKQYVDYDANTVVHRCCGHCSRLLSSSARCTGPECLSANASNAYFVEVLINKQLEIYCNGKTMFIYVYMYMFQCIVIQ